MTTINRATWTDDDGSGMTGTILNNARLQGDIYDKVDGALATLDTKDASQDTAIAANGPHSVLSAQHPDTVPAALVAGDVLTVNAANKLVRLPKGIDGAALVLATGLPAWTAAALGQWVTVPYVAGNFTAFGSMVWTVDLADQVTFMYCMIGARTAVLILNIANSTFSGTAGPEVYVQLPFTPAATITVYGRYHNGAAQGMGVFYVVSGNSKLNINVYPSGNFTLGTNNQSVQITMIIPV